MPSDRKKVSKRGLPKRTGNRKAQHAAYYDNVRPYRKLLHLYKNGASVKMLRAWADAHIGGNAALVRLGKEKGLNVSQVG